MWIEGTRTKAETESEGKGEAKGKQENIRTKKCEEIIRIRNQGTKKQNK